MEINIDYASIGIRIRTARHKKRLTQETLANAAELAPTYISSIENGRTKLSLPTIIQIAQVLDTTVDALLYDNTPVLYSQYDADVKEILDDCTQKERIFLLNLIKAAKNNLRKTGLSK